MKAQHDDKLIRCPKLGDEMTLEYCLRESGELPCQRIVRCWSLSFDVESFLREKLTLEQYNSFVNAQQKEKVTSLIELIEAAKAKK
jgi:hypothetical protein